MDLYIIPLLRLIKFKKKKKKSTSKAFKVIINPDRLDLKKKKKSQKRKPIMQIITAENISLQPTSTDTYTSPKPHTQYTTTIILKLRWISIDSYPGKKTYRMVTTDNSDGWLCLEEWNCSGEKEFPVPLVLCASDLNWCPWGKCWNSPYRACSGSLKIGCTLCQICCSLNKDKVLTWSQIMGAKIHNSLQWFSLLSVKIMKPTIERIRLNILNKR